MTAKSRPRLVSPSFNLISLLSHGYSDLIETNMSHGTANQGVKRAKIAMGKRAECLLEPAWRAAPGDGLAWWFIVHEHRQPSWVAAASVLRLIKETA